MTGTDLDPTARQDAGPPDDVPPSRRAARARDRRRTVLALVVVAALVGLPLLGVGGWFLWELSPPGDAGAPVQVSIEAGWGAKQTGDALQANDVIGSSLAFQIWAKVSGVSFQAGTYDLREHLGVREAADALEQGPVAPPHLTLALPPGLTLSQIADRVGRLPGHSRESFLAAAASGVVRSRLQPPDVTSLEGLTWPDTYFVGEGQSDEEILDTIVGAFDEHAAAAGVTSYDAVRIASLVQAEANAEDADKVSAVIRNRIARGHAAADRRHALLREGGLSTGPEQRRQADRLAVQHLPRDRAATHADHDCHRACVARRTPSRGCPVPLLRHRRRRRHPVRDDARGAPTQHRRARGARRMSEATASRVSRREAQRRPSGPARSAESGQK